MLPWIDLNRVLLPVASSHEASVAMAFGYHSERVLTWHRALAFPCLVVLGEAGSGKTRELRAQAERLRAEGHAAFFLPVEGVAKDGLDLALDEGTNLLNDWRRSDAPGWFFLDSVDEAKLHSESLDRAIRKLARDLDSALSRSHVIVSSRHTDWREEDREYLERLAPQLISEPSSDSERPEMPDVVTDARFKVPVLRLAPLSRPQVREFAAQRLCVADADAFLAAIQKADLWALAGRPLDVEWLAASWNRKKSFDSLRAMMEEAIDEKISERKDPRLFPSAPSKRECREAVEELALGCTLTQREAISLPGTSHAGDNVLPSEGALHNWKAGNLPQLLERPLFDPATFGRVRFHHRAIREYLAAACLRRLRQNGLPRRELRQVLFANVEGREVIRPGLEPIVAWLALSDNEVREHAVRVAPEHLMDLGDPGQLPPDIRLDLLRSYANRFVGRRRTFHHFDRAGLRRFGCDDIVPLARELLQPGQPVELREALLEMATARKLVALADTAEAVAIEVGIPSFLRVCALRAVAEIASMKQKRRVTKRMLLDFVTEREVARSLLAHFFPGVLSLDDVVAVLKATLPHPRYVDGLHRQFQSVATACPGELRRELLDKLLQLFKNLELTKRETVGDHLEWTPLVVELLNHVLSSQGEGNPPNLAVFARLLKASKPRSSFQAIELEHQMEAMPTVRRALFWHAVQQTQRVRKGAKSWSSPWPHGVLVRTRADADWLEKDATGQAEARQRLLAFDEMTLALNPRDLNDRARLERVARARPELEKHWDRLWKPLGFDGHDPYSIAWSFRRMQWSELREHRRNHERLRETVDSLRQGKALEELIHLYVIGCQRSSRVGWSRVDVAEKYDVEVADAAQAGLRRLWRFAPAPNAEQTSNDLVVQMAICGLNIDIGEGLDPLGESAALQRSAIGYAILQTDEFPKWLGPYAQRSGGILREVLEPAIRSDWRLLGRSRILRKVAGSSTPVREHCAGLVCELLTDGDPADEELLDCALDALAGMPSTREKLLELCPARVNENVGNSARFALWWRTWFGLDPSLAITGLREMLGQLDAAAAQGHLYACIPSRKDAVLQELHSTVEDLLDLLDVLMRYVHPDDDVEDFHSPRFDAQQHRAAVVNALVETGAVEAIRGLDGIAAGSWRDPTRGDLFRRYADDCAVRNARRQWAPEELASLLEHHVIIPHTSAELFQVALDALADIRDHIERGDDSPRRAYFDKEQQEREFQILFRGLLERRSKGRYQVTREDELADGTKPDLRVWANGCGPVSIEVKIAGACTLEELELALSEQLVGQYMKDASARCGVLLVAKAAPRPRGWQRAGEDLQFSEVIERLKAQAAKLVAASRGKIEGLVVIAIDFAEPQRKARRSPRRAHVG